MIKRRDLNDALRDEPIRKTDAPLMRKVKRKVRHEFRMTRINGAARVACATFARYVSFDIASLCEREKRERNHRALESFDISPRAHFRRHPMRGKLSGEFIRRAGRCGTSVEKQPNEKRCEKT